MSHPRRSVTPRNQLVVVQDTRQVCPYLPDRVARMPLRMSVGGMTPQFVDHVLASGYRRSGRFVYRTQCPSCEACEPTRVEVAGFRWTASMRRVWNRAERKLDTRWGSPAVDGDRVRLFDRHRRDRDLGRDDGPIDADGYRGFLVDSCCHTEEWSAAIDGRLIAVSTTDIGEESLSAVYTFFDPDQSRYSLGTLAVLHHMRRAIDEGYRYVYLGMYVADNPHLNYKARFRPQQRLVAGKWEDREG